MNVSNRHIDAYFRNECSGWLFLCFYLQIILIIGQPKIVEDAASLVQFEVIVIFIGFWVLVIMRIYIDLEVLVDVAMVIGLNQIFRIGQIVLC